MGWFSSSEKDAEPDLTTKKDRQNCWESRDIYFQCLDSSGVLKPGDEGQTKCSKERSHYEKNCAKSWVDYFNQRRVLAEQQKESLAMAQSQEEGARRRTRT